MSGQEDYDELNSVTDGYIQGLIDSEVDEQLDSLEATLLADAQKLKNLSADPRIRALPDIADFIGAIDDLLTQMESVSKVVTAADSMYAAGLELQTLSCGDYEIGPKNAFAKSAQLYQDSSTATISLLDAFSKGLAAAALIPGGAFLAIPAAGLGMTKEALEGINEVVLEILALSADAFTKAGESTLISLNLHIVDPVGDSINILYGYASLPEPEPEDDKGDPPGDKPPAPGSGGDPGTKEDDPLVLDLDGDGVEVTGRGDPSVFWDPTNSGLPVLTAWVDPDDGFLVRDLDGDGAVDGQSELFGNSTLNALDDLALSDSNGDGLIDRRDEIWASLQVWRDLDQDAVSDAGEMVSVEEAGIVRLSLDRRGGQSAQLVDGQAAGFGLFVTDDGMTHEMAAVDFTTSTFVTQHDAPDGTDLTPEIMDLPQLHGMGRVPDLHLAMALDPDLLAAVQALESTGRDQTGVAFHASFEAMVWQWVGLSPDDFATQADFAAAFLAKIRQVDPSLGSGVLASQEPDMYQETIDGLALRFVIELAVHDLAAGHGDSIFTPFAQFSHDPVSGFIQGYPEMVVAAILADLPANHASAMDQLEQTMPLLSSLQWEFYDRNQAAFRADLTAWISEGVTDAGLLSLAVDLASASYVLRGTGAGEQIVLPHSHFLDFADADVMVVDAGLGDDTIDHGIGATDRSGADVLALLYRQGDGDDVIDVSGNDHILHRVYLRDIDHADAVIRMGADGLSPVITFRDGGSITFTNVTETFFSIEVYFADGVVADQFAIITEGGTNTNETIIGSFGDDQIDGGAGADQLEGGAGDDTYHYFAGSGRDRIVEEEIAGYDTLCLHDRTAADMRVTNVAGDAVLTFASAPGEQVTLQGQFSQGLLASEFFNFIEQIRFSDGRIMTADQLIERLYLDQSTNGSDSITGEDVAETFHLGRGADTVVGGGGQDIYIRDKGKSGADVISGMGANLILNGVTRAEVAFSQSGTSLLLDLPGTADLTVTDQFGTLGFNTIQRVTFGDGSFLTADQIAALFTPVLAATLPAGSGNDTLNGTTGADGLNGKAGDDLLRGGLGGDSYYWGRNKGSDTITDNGFGTWVETDRLILGGVTLANLGLARSLTDDLILTDKVTGKTLTVTQHFLGTTHSIEEIRLDGGEVLTLSQIAAMAVLTGTAANQTIEGSDVDDAIDGAGGNDLLDGEAGDDTLTGGTGNDTLVGRTGSDTYVIGLGQGQDVITDSYFTNAADADGDTLRLTGVTLDDLQFDILSQNIGDDLLIHLGTGGDTVLISDMFDPFLFNFEQGGVWRILFDDGTALDRNEIRALAEIRGTSGNDAINGTSGNDRIVLDAGNDTVNTGGGGDDVFVWGEGAGNDTVSDSGPREEAGLHTVELAGLTRADVTLTRLSNDDMTITILATGEVLTITDQFRVTVTGTHSGVGHLTFADGTTLDREGIARALPIAGGAGADFLLGSYGLDVLTGGGGADELDGGLGSDIYLWRKGDGNDLIWDSSSQDGDLDSLDLTDLLPGDVTFARDRAEMANLLIRVTATGEVVTIGGAFLDMDADKQLRLADGSVVDIRSLADLPVLGRAKNDTIRGDDSGTVFDGGAGNDSIAGGLGDDTYVWRAGAGDDRINEGFSFDGGDVLRLEGVSLADVNFQRSAFDRIAVTVDGAAGSVTILRALNGPMSGIESFVFDDGSLSFAQVRDLLALETVVGAAGSNDTLIGTNGNELFLPDTGNDLIQGKGGRDHLSIGPGSGDDTLEGFVGGAFGTVLQIDSSLAADMAAVLAVASQVGADVVLTFAPGTSLTLRDSRISDLDAANFGFVAAEIFGSGVISGSLLADRLSGDKTANEFNGRAGNDTIMARAGDDVIHLFDGDGHDLINGGLGWDGVTYTGSAGVVVNLAAGSMTGAGLSNSLIGIEMAITSSGADRFIGNAGANSAELGAGADTGLGGDGGDFLFGGDGNDDLQGQTDGDLLSGGNGNDSLNGGSGNDFMTGDLNDDLLLGGSGNDLLDGSYGNDVLDGGRGDDDLNGGAGADTLTGGTGTDFLRYDDIADGGDSIIDFRSGEDHFEFVSDGFGGLDVGVLLAARFRSGTSDVALTKAVRFFFETDTATLRYDPDGSGLVEASVLAILQPGDVVSLTDLLIV